MHPRRTKRKRRRVNRIEKILRQRERIKLEEKKLEHKKDIFKIKLIFMVARSERKTPWQDVYKFHRHR